MKLEELNYWVRNKADYGDIAYAVDRATEKAYMYFYIGPDEYPYWREVNEAEVKKELYEKQEKDYMKKRCDNCKYFHDSGPYSFCVHKDQNGIIVPKFTVCDKHEPKEERPGPFDNLKFFIKDTNTGELDIKCVCEDCGKVMDKPFHWQIRLPVAHNGKKPTSRPGYYFYCEECYNKNKKDGKI